MRPLHGISKEGLGVRVGRTKVWALGTERIRLGQVPNLPHQGTELSCFVLTE